MKDSGRPFLPGARSELPLLVGVFPFGLIYGASALASGLSPAAAQAIMTLGRRAVPLHEPSIIAPTPENPQWMETRRLLSTSMEPFTKVRGPTK
jgi:hypothetical protein